jgi:hypothetical protein
MPRYFFHILHPDSSPVTDDEGAEFADLEAAKEEAAASIREMTAEAIKFGSKGAGLGMEIMDEAGKILSVINAKEVFD